MSIKHCLSIIGLAAAVLLLPVVGVGCATPNQAVVIDRPTPPGDIPPMMEPQPTPQPYRPDGTASPVSSASTEDMDRAVSVFRAAYGRSKQPRIAIYVNRTLSGEVREWKSDTRANITYAETVKKDEGGKKSATETQGTASAAIQNPVRDDSEGPAVEDQWAWRLEDAIQGPFLQSGAKVVDRKVIMRLAAAASGPGGPELSVKNIEVAALKGHADILAEVSMSREPDQKRGYIYRVRAYEINTGRVLATASSASWPRSKQTSAELVATSTGYERSGYPNPEKLGRWLALDLMKGLQGSL